MKTQKHPYYKKIYINKNLFVHNSLKFISGLKKQMV